MPRQEVRVPPPEQDTIQPIAPAEAAFRNDWMSLGSTGVDRFQRRYPAYDGRGVIIGILDTGIDAGAPGLQQTSTGDPKLLDLRDFSDEGRVPLRRVTPRGDTLDIAGRRMLGFSRVAALNAAGPWYAGTLREIPLGAPPAADVNANGVVGDTLAVVVTRAAGGWVLLADTDGDGSLANERPVRDYLTARETFGWAPISPPAPRVPGSAGPRLRGSSASQASGRAVRLTMAANFSEAGGEPVLNLVFDNHGHGTHVAGIAAGNDLYGVAGFDGVAPGAHLLGLKIANGAQGGVSTTGAILGAIDYAIRFAQARQLPLVLNLSFGVGNEIEGAARIDGLIDSVLAAHPELALTVSAGNDGPGLSTVGFPGSARRAIGVGATLPAAFLQRGPGGAGGDVVAYFSARGGELAKPDLVTPGVAYSTVPRWNRGDEIEQGTSMAAPHAAGLVARLVSALAQDSTSQVGRASVDRASVGRGLDPSADAQAIKQALMATARPLPGATPVDAGAGVPDVERAYEWLRGPADTPAGPGVRTADTLARPGVRSTDTLLGSAFRRVNAGGRAHPVTTVTRTLRPPTGVPAGGVLRTFFMADSARPFELTVMAGDPPDRGLAFLHEPNGMPYRGGAAAMAGPAERTAVYQVDARDVVPGAYEVVAVAPPAQGFTATVTVTHAPFLLRVAHEGSNAVAELRNTTAAPVETQVAMAVNGGERVESIAARGSAVQRIPFTIPRWATAVTVDVTMDRAQWGRFTDLGLTLFDSAGRQIAKQPLNYAFGRLEAELPAGHEDVQASLALFPGFAEPGADEPWAVRVSIRMYADSAVSLAPVAASKTKLTVAPRKTARVLFRVPESPWPLPPGFAPLGMLVAEAGGKPWSREAALR